MIKAIIFDCFGVLINGSEQKNHQLLTYIKTVRETYKTAMLSNIGKESLNKRFSVQELTAHFDAVVASGEVGFAKPEARIYEITADKLGVRCDECIFTDDRPDYCEGARAVGMQAIVYKNNEQFMAELTRLLQMGTL